MGKRVLLTSIGSYGDLHPFIAVGVALKARGLEAVVAAEDGYRAKIEAEGLEFRPVRPSREQFMRDHGVSEGEIVRRLARSGAAFVMKDTVIPYLEQSYADLMSAAAGANVVVGSSFTLAARIVAAKRGLPMASLLLSPCMFASAEDPPTLLEAPWLPALRRACGAGVVRPLMALGRARVQSHAGAVNRLRRREGLPIPKGDELVDGFLAADRVIALYSPLLGPLPPEAPAAASIAGFTFYDSERGGAPRLDRNLEAFLAEGPPPLVFSLGSLGVFAAERFYDDAAAVAARLGHRAVLLTGAEGFDRSAGLASKEVFVAPYASHSLVFPRAAAVIHHGGIGTVGQAMRAGRPQLICPMLGDQLDNAARLQRLGVARWIVHRRFNPGRAVRALDALLGNRAIEARAAKIAEMVAL